MELSDTAFSSLLFDSSIIPENMGKAQKNSGSKDLKNAENKGMITVFLCTFLFAAQLVFIAFGCSISMPDISQSNSLQVRLRTSDLFLGHR